MATLGTPGGGGGGDGGIDEISSCNYEGATSIRRRPELHVRCIPGEDTVNLYLDLHDNTAVTLNRYSVTGPCSSGDADFESRRHHGAMFQVCVL